MAPVPASVLAHQGGWDEILFVLAPLLLFAALLLIARRRADQMDDPARDGAAGDPSAAGAPPGEMGEAPAGRDRTNPA